MNRIIAAFLFSLIALFMPYYEARADTFGFGENSFEIEFVPITHPGNKSEPAFSRNGNPVFEQSGKRLDLGSVGYDYAISKFEIPHAAVTAANLLGGLRVPLSERTAPNGPAIGHTWGQAARFVNWLNESKGYPHAYKFKFQPPDPGYPTFEPAGFWEPGESGYDSANPVRNALAKYVIASEDEWYKAAFYDPSRDAYSTYATGSDIAPTPVPSGTEPGTAVYLQPLEQSPAPVTAAGGLSSFGVMGMSGNAFEWVERTENRSDVTVRYYRDCGYTCNEIGISSAHRTYIADEFGGSMAIRVVSLPEPNSPTSWFVAMGLIWSLRRRFRETRSDAFEGHAGHDGNVFE